MPNSASATEGLESPKPTFNPDFAETHKKVTGSDKQQPDGEVGKAALNLIYYDQKECK